MEIKSLVVGELEANCYIVMGDENEAVVIDPGSDAELILTELKEKNLNVKYIINTHGHTDHTNANAELKERIIHHPPICIHKEAVKFFPLVEEMCELFGFVYKPFTPDRLLQDGDIIEISGLRLEVIYTPGHSPDGICLKAGNILFSGDTLFANGIGRTDLPGCSEVLLRESIAEKLLSLDNEIVVYPGHGADTTIGRERGNL